MRKTISVFVVALILAAAAFEVSAQQRDIAEVGHRRNNPNNVALAAPNSSFSGWVTGGNADFTLFTTNPPTSYMVNKVNGGLLANCTANLTIANSLAIADFSATFGPAGVDLLMTGQGNFNVVCGATVLTGSFSRAILHVYNGSNSGAITLLANTVTYVAPTNVINNGPGNFSFNQGSLSIGFITDQPVQVVAPTPVAPGSVSNFRAYSNVTFGATKLP